ncbi:MAG TPA: hypothetical protein VG245_04590, partial [Candidatus Dormibacteraeota bacterium]|nr:hypothetical protein [Candidatus Dormibacteraeota bacterium]
VGSKHLWTYPIPATWGHGIAWPDKMQLKVWIKKVETFLQTTTPPQPAPGPAPAPAPPGNVIISFLGAAISIPVSALQAVGSAIASAPQNVLKLILESTLAEYHDDVNIQGLQTYRGDLFREMFVDPGAGKKQGVGKYGSKFTIDYTLVGA